MDHRLAQCPYPDPRSSPGGSNPNKPKVNKPNARIYALPREDDKNPNEVLADIYVLFDFGAIHSL